MDNSATLRQGSQIARDLIARHLLNTILVPMANDALAYAVNKRIGDGHNMTGNTVNSYVVGVFVKGRLAYMRGSWESIPRPLRRKLNAGQLFHAGQQRWDEETQKHTFTAEISTNGTTEPERAIAFIRSYQANPKGWTIVVANGVEYVTYEENVYDADTLTGAYEDFKFTHQLHFNPLPD